MHCKSRKASLFLEEVPDNVHAGGRIYSPGSFADQQVAVTSSDLQCVVVCVCAPKKQWGRNECTTQTMQEVLKNVFK